MTQSLPGQATPVGPPRAAKGPVVNALAGLTLRGLPRIPNPVKRLLLGGRSITIDGNTLDTTLQLMLAGMTAVGLNALVASPDVVAARTQLRILAASFKQDIPVAHGDQSLDPRPGRSDPARHYRPIDGDGRTAAGLLSRRRPGHRRPRHARRPVPPDLPRGRRCTCCRWTTGSPPSTRRPPASDDAYAAFQWALDHAAELGADPGRVAVGGDSAGGNLAALVSQRARERGHAAARVAAAVLPGHQLPRRDAVADVVRRGVLPHQARFALVPAAVPRTARGSTPPTRGCRRCWPTTCPGCRRRWC